MTTLAELPAILENKLDEAREKVWNCQGLSEQEKEQERLMVLLKRPAPTSSPVLDYIMSVRNKK